MNSHKTYWLPLCSVLMVSFFPVSALHRQGDQHVEFDSPFRSVWYKKALDIGTIVWNELDMLAQTDKGTFMPDYTILILDASVGRISYLEYCIQMVFQELPHVDKRSPDFAYLAQIMGEIVNLMEPLSRIIVHDRFTCFQSILDRINRLIVLEE